MENSERMNSLPLGTRISGNQITVLYYFSQLRDKLRPGIILDKLNSNNGSKLGKKKDKKNKVKGYTTKQQI